MNLSNIKTFSKEILENDVTGHDWEHALRVEKNAMKIAPNDLNDTEIENIKAAVWLHDVIDEKVTNHVTVKDVEHILYQNQATCTQIDEILHIIQNLSYSKNIEQRQKLTFIGQIVQDADRLDALGAIGIARAFYYGGSQQHPLYNDECPRKTEQLTEQNYRKTTSVINHFYEKLFILQDQMNTETGEKEAIIRTNRMKKFLKDFFSEINRK